MSAQPIPFRKPAPPPPKPVDQAAVAFQPDAAVIEERRPPWAARSVIYIVTALIISAALWASFSRVDRVVTARGKLITIDPLMVVQPLETAVIRTINVGVGDTVRAGAVLAIGISAMLFWQTFINVGMVVGIVPVVGVPLPLLSYGGTSVITTTMGIALLMNIGMRRFMLSH